MGDTLTHSFAELLEMARGPRTVNEFAASCHISRAHFFRIKNGLVPSKKICMRLADDSYVKKLGISEKEIFEAAGYVYDGGNAEACMYVPKGNIAFYQRAIDWSIVAQMLMALEAEAKLINVLEHDVSFAFRLFNGKQETIWKFIVVNDTLLDASDKDTEDTYYSCLGRIFSIKPLKGEQYTLLLHNSQAFERLISQANLFLGRLCISIALVEAQSLEITREAIIGSGSVRYTLTENVTEIV